MLFFGFAQKHHQHFTEECDFSKVEHTLETTNVHKEFCGIFEEVVEKVVNEVHEKASGEDFIAALKWQSEQEDQPEHGSVAEIMLSSVSFETFVKLMAHYKSYMNAGAIGTFGQTAPV